jgi:hypothetical protein
MAVNMLNFDNVIINFLKDVLLEEENLKSLKRIINQETIKHIQSLRDKIVSLQEKAAVLESNIKTINMSLANSNKAMEKILYSELKESIVEKERLEAEIEQLRLLKEPVAKYLNDIKGLIRPDRRLLKTLDIENHKIVLSKYIKRIRLSNDGATIHVPLNLFVDGLYSQATIPFRINRYFIVNPQKYSLPRNLDSYDLINEVLN